MKITKKFTVTSVLLITAVTLTACGETPSEKGSTVRKPVEQIVNISATANREVFDLLPKGPNNFSIKQEMGTVVSDLSGYVNFDDCTTEATGNAVINGKPRTLRYVNAGTGESVSKDGGPFIDIISPKAEGILLITPMYVLQNSVLSNQGIACSLNNLSELAKVDSASNSSDGTVLSWDYPRADKFALTQSKLTVVKTFKAVGATDADIIKYDSIITALSRISPKNIMEKQQFIISKEGETTIIKVFRTDKKTPELMITYTFTPTEKVSVVPVPFKNWYDELNEEFLASGKTFEEYNRINE